MCLAIPGQIVELLDDELQLAKVDVSGVRRNINVGLVDSDEDRVKVGDWVLIHVGFAMSKIDEAQAQETLRILEEIGAAYQEEMAEFHASRIE